MPDDPVEPATGPTVAEVEALFALPLTELVYRAQTAHRRHFDPAAVQLSTLLSVKTGACPEDCAYCPQSAHYDTGLGRERLLDLGAVRAAARSAKERGASRFCMGAAWRSPSERDLEQVAAMVETVRAEGMETCATLGMLSGSQARRLKAAGLDFYNHNLDTSPEYYGRIITTRTYQERLDTLTEVRAAGIKVCCGGIIGMGESRRDRAALLAQLAALDPAPESVPINALVRVAGTPLESAPPLDPLEFVRTVAVARLLMPESDIRLSAGRKELGETAQALCFLAGANSIFFGEQLLTTPNPALDEDLALLARLGMHPREAAHTGDRSVAAPAGPVAPDPGGRSANHAGRDRATPAHGRND